MNRKRIIWTWLLKDLLAISLTTVICSCAHKGPSISGDFGEIFPPKGGQIAILRLKSGEEKAARKLQEENDTLYAQNPDFSISSIPMDSIENIYIRTISDSEKIEVHGRKLTEEEKSALTLVGIHGAAWVILILPFLFLGWLASDFIDSL